MKDWNKLEVAPDTLDSCFDLGSDSGEGTGAFPGIGTCLFRFDNINQKWVGIRADCEGDDYECPPDHDAKGKRFRGEYRRCKCIPKPR